MNITLSEHASPAIIALIVLLISSVLKNIKAAKKGKKIFIRRIPGINAIEDGIGRAIELGRPMSFTSGLCGVTPLLFASLSVLRHIARKTAMFKSRLIVPSSDPSSLPLIEATLQNAWRTENCMESYDPQTLQFLSEDQFAFASGYMGIMHRENVASAFLFGRFAAESLILAEAGQQVGALQIAATDAVEQVPYFITSCDYTLIGEELYAAGAYLSPDDPILEGSLKGQDIGKLVLTLIIVVGTVEVTLASMLSVESNLVRGGLLLNWEDIKEYFMPMFKAIVNAR